jgi:hypothetical protein
MVDMWGCLECHEAKGDKEYNYEYRERKWP